MSSVVVYTPDTPDTSVAVRRVRPAALTLRVFATVQIVLVLLQPFWIGLYLDGQYGALDLHEVGATAIGFASLLMLIPAIWYSVVARRRVVVPVLAFVLLLLVGAQTGFGYGRFLGGHVPLGVALVVLQLGFCLWTWTRAASVAARPRRSKNPT